LGEQLEFITFLLALFGYAGLTAVTVMAAGGHVPTRLLRMTAAVIVVHVLMVWHVRYDWRNGYAGFALFHGALAAILSSLVTSPPVARRLLTAAFLVVSLGAIAATFKYDVVRHYRVPVLLIAVTGIIMSGYRSRRTERRRTA
jgi:hypothetical protein